MYTYINKYKYTCKLNENYYDYTYVIEEEFNCVKYNKFYLLHCFIFISFQTIEK